MVRKDQMEYEADGDDNSTSWDTDNDNDTVAATAPAVEEVVVVVDPVASREGLEEKMESGAINDFDDMNWDTESDEEPVSTTAANEYRGGCEAGPSRPSLVSRFIGMGFSEEMIEKAIKENGEEDKDALLDALLSYSAIKEDSHSQIRTIVSADTRIPDEELKKDEVVSMLVEMGFLAKEATSAIDVCGQNASILELTDYISASRMAQESDSLQSYSTSSSFHDNRKRSGPEIERGMKRSNQMYNGSFDDDELSFSIPSPGYDNGLRNDRNLPEAVRGPPYFYFEKITLPPEEIYRIEAEYIDSKNFSALAGRKGYIHNLPVADRFHLQPIPPKTIQDALPVSKKHWPAWDTRTHLNCLQNSYGSVQSVSKVCKVLDGCNDPPPQFTRNHVLEECRKGNLVWVGPHKVDCINPNELEALLGFPENHTRGVSMTDRYKSLGNSFQIDTLAFHLSVLREMYPGGMNVLSLCSGIGGAEVALHRLGIRLKIVVSLEFSEVNRRLVRAWWEQTYPSDNLIQFSKVSELSDDKLKQLIKTHGGFDLVIGSRPFSNSEGNSRNNYTSLELFRHYFTILNAVRDIMGRRN